MHIFYCAGGKFGEVAGLKTLTGQPQSTKGCSCVSGALLFLGRGEGSTRHSASDGGQTLLVHLVMHDIHSENASVSD